MSDLVLARRPARTEAPVAAPAPWACNRCGAGLDGACAVPAAGVCRIDAEVVSHRLEQAGMTLLAMRVPSPYPAPYRCALPEVLREAIEAYGWTDEPTLTAVPDAAEITRMDQAFGWLALIPKSRHVLRRIVAARCLVSPESGRHLMT
ncbi:MAG TPA: DUF6362 family protein, partial [Rhodopila sp.]|nr:DUF6362 family protein [Rhodopila sp.]